ncbi:hypothetical protein Thena_0931 [Thermodesulfobium narugense DSM 14796]|uniref:Uncharacterized protein n=1 Tax=Thermodesulfobium narugense DSM 14796 TaxID=747365 RepID=M1E7P0_9BACT|nr:hypothetical protein [Thermodesulfobium narugense]AEE14560.1 hypothetical protein Thena_0931 [Thermodesulfobium narugense DSM 14796]
MKYFIALFIFLALTFLNSLGLQAKTLEFNKENFLKGYNSTKECYLNTKTPTDFVICSSDVYEKDKKEKFFDDSFKMGYDFSAWYIMNKYSLTEDFNQLELAVTRDYFLGFRQYQVDFNINDKALFDLTDVDQQKTKDWIMRWANILNEDPYASKEK